MSNVSYPYDDSGHAATNLIQGEIQVLTLGNNTPYRYFIPTFAPFYETNFKLFGRDALGNERELIRNVDYNFNLTFIGATRGNGAAIWGGVNIINQTVQGPVKLNYQCLGGKYSADRDFVVRTIAENNYNPRVVAWDQVTSIQELFPPSRHPQDLDTFTGYRDLIDAVQGFHDHPDEFQTLKDLIWNHMLNVNDPHETKKLLDEYALKADVAASDKQLKELIDGLGKQLSTTQDDLKSTDNRVTNIEVIVNDLKSEVIRIVENVPSNFIATAIIVTKPHTRFMIWNETYSNYVRAPWHRPGMLSYSYHNPSEILGWLPVRGDISYNKANYPDLMQALGIAGTGTFSLVEMRGEFLRVLDNSRGIDVNRSLLSFQNFEVQRHFHGDGLDQSGFDADKGNNNRKRLSFGDGPPWGGIVIDMHYGGNETRPRNIAVPLWISY